MSHYFGWIKENKVALIGIVIALFGAWLIDDATKSINEPILLPGGAVFTPGVSFNQITDESGNVIHQDVPLGRIDSNQKTLGWLLVVIGSVLPLVWKVKKNRKAKTTT